MLRASATAAAAAARRSLSTAAAGKYPVYPRGSKGGLVQLYSGGLDTSSQLA